MMYTSTHMKEKLKNKWSEKDLKPWKESKHGEHWRLQMLSQHVTSFVQWTQNMWNASLEVQVNAYRVIFLFALHLMLLWKRIKLYRQTSLGFYFLFIFNQWVHCCFGEDPSRFQLVHISHSAALNMFRFGLSGVFYTLRCFVYVSLSWSLILLATKLKNCRNS